MNNLHNGFHAPHPDPLTDLPDIALSVRQPCAWAIIHAGKDVENRSAAEARSMYAARIAIHASKGMTRDEYEDARDFMRSISVECPRPDDLVRGGVIGAVDALGYFEWEPGGGLETPKPWMMSWEAR